MPLIGRRRNDQRLVRINWSHPVSRGLVACVLFGPQGQNGMINMAAANGQPTLGPSQHWWKTTVAGPGLFCATPGNTTISPWSLPDYMNFAAGDLTVRCRFVPNSWPFVESLYAKVEPVGGTGEVSVLLDGSGNQTSVQVGQQGDSNLYTTNYVLQALCEHTMTRVGLGTNSTTYYANGKSIGTHTFNGTGAEAFPLVICRDNTNGHVGDFIYISFQIWNRGLSANEVLQIFQDPECFLIQVDDPLLIMQAPPPPILMPQIVF